MVLSCAVKGKASFKDGKKRWTSHHSVATFGYNRDRDRVFVVKVYRQKSVGASRSKKYVKPWFKPKEFDRMKEVARTILRTKRKKRGDASHPDVEELDYDFDKSHRADLCERCLELGHSCTGIAYDVMGTPVRLSHAAWKRRSDRLEPNKKNQSPNTTILYHQTDKDAAMSILSSQRMFRGDRGLCGGGGIYFAASPKATEKKARQKGVILKCHVLLGQTKVIEREGDKSITFASLIEKGYDSVKCLRSPPEYVVYNYDQIVKIELN